MQLEDYFDFISPEEIRLKGHRIGIETVLYEYLHHGRTAEEIAEQLPSLTLEQVYATILYYLHEQAQMHAYMRAWIEHGRQRRAEQAQYPSPARVKLRRIREERGQAPEKAAS